jgi:hypothetical protein
MATKIAGGLHRAQEVLQNTSSKSKKLVDLERDTADAHTQQPLTTDHGVRVSNTDQWLRVTNDRRTGPSLLEDQIAREKVNILHVNTLNKYGIDDIRRSIALIMNVFLKESSMRVALAHSETSSLRRALKI